MKISFLVCLLAISTQTAFSQFDKSYTPAPIQDTIPADVYKAMKGKLERDKARLPVTDKQVDSFLKKLYDDRTDMVIEQFNDDHILIDKNITPYLQAILANIYKANTALTTETTVYAYRSEAVNAMSFGEGTIGFTLGLLERMETEAQIAYVLCHELAHYHAHHSETKALALAKLNYDKTLKKQVRKIEKDDYGKFTKFSKLMGSLGVSITRHGREKEFEADSLALQYYLRTDYDLTAPVRVLEILDSADNELDATTLDMKGTFNNNGYPFKDSWLTYTPATTWYASEDTPDSLRTHPSCAKRIVAIKRQLAAAHDAAPRKDVYYHQQETQHIRTQAQFEAAASGYHFKHYGRSLYNSLILAKRYPDNTYLQAMIGQSLYQLYRYQKIHELGNVLSLPDPRFEENYDRYLTFMHNLRLMELASITYYYTADKTTKHPDSEDLLYAYWLACNTEVSQQSAAQTKTDYTKRFPTGKHLALMK